MPCIWLDATYVKCRREGHVAFTAIGCDSGGWRHVLGISAVDAGPYGAWKSFLESIRARGAMGIQLVVSDAHEGLKRAMAEVFQGAAWQRCAVHLMRGCIRAARIVAPVSRAKDAAPQAPTGIRAAR